MNIYHKEIEKNKMLWLKHFIQAQYSIMTHLLVYIYIYIFCQFCMKSNKYLLEWKV